MTGRRDEDERTQLDGESALVDLDKRGIFGYPAGKTRLSPELVKLIPAHKVYVEPFCGSAAVYFDKAHEADVEVLNDAREDLIELYRDIAALTDAELDKLAGFDWLGKAKTFDGVFKSKPSDRVGRVYRGLYLARFSRFKDGRRGEFDTTYEGSKSRAVARVRSNLARLKRAKLFCGDYEKVVRKFDSPETFHFFDPPYVGYNAGVGEREFDEDRFVGMLRSLKGRFLVTYGVRGQTKFEGFKMRRIRDDKARNLPGTEHGVETLLISNYTMSHKRDDGVEIVSLDDDELSEAIDKQAEPPRDLPSKPGPLPAVYQYHVRGKSIHGDLRLSVGDHLIGWTLAVQRPGTLTDSVDTMERAKEIARGFSVDGDRYAKPIRAPRRVLATPKDRHSLKWLDAEGELRDEGEDDDTSEGLIVVVDRPRVEFGLQGDDSRELFLTKGARLNGIVFLRKLRDERGEAWTASLLPTALPGVLRRHAVESGTMPEPGRSALPVSLEREVPPEFRYWNKRGDESRKMRDALVASGLFTEGNVRIVSGEFRRVVAKLYLADEVPEPDSLDWIDRIAKVTSASDVVEVFGDELPDSSALVYHDFGVMFDDAATDIDRMIGRLGKREFVLSAADASHTREALSKIGEVFRFKPDRSTGVEALDRVFVSTMPLARVDDVEFVDLLEAEFIDKRAPSESMSREQLVEARNERSREFGIEVLETGGALTYPSGAPTDLRLYGDPVNLKYPVETAERASNARARFKQNADRYQKPGSRATVHERIVRAELKFGIDPSFDPDDALDALLSSELKTQLTKGDKRSSFDKLLAREIPIIKSERKDEERFVLGVVLEPETVDSQGDIYSAEEVRSTAHRFMAEYQRIGFMHRASLDGRVKILESYIAPAEFKIGGQTVKAGTWLLAVRVLDRALWKAIKLGEFTGFSIGGSAVRSPERRS